MRRLMPALVTLYLLWGSTYLAIRVMVEEIPPLLGAGLRSALAGAVLLGIAWLRGRPAPRGWARPSLAGLLLIPGGMGLVCVASQYVPSGVAALVMATVPGQLVLWAWALGGPRPSASALVGVVLGLTGVGVLAGASLEGPPWAIGLLLVAAGGWSVGSLLLRHEALPVDPSQGVGMAILVGGLGSMAVSLGLGERMPVPSPRVAAAFGWLVVMGSIVGGSVYAWALRNGPPRLVGTYAFVNPVVAVALGALLLGEPVSWRMAAGGAVVLVGVVLLLSSPVSNEVDLPKEDPDVLAPVVRLPRPARGPQPAVARSADHGAPRVRARS